MALWLPLHILLFREGNSGDVIREITSAFAHILLVHESGKVLATPSGRSAVSNTL